MHAITPESSSCVSTPCYVPEPPQGSDVLHQPDPSFLEQIVRIRERQAASVLVHGSDQSSLVQCWHSLFERIFLSGNSQHESNTGPRDDLLFFVNKKLSTDSSHLLQVHRKNSSKVPSLDNPLIDWEETLYLNLLMQFFVYVVTVAVCTRTGPQELQILSKFSQIVYVSPSRRRMDNKGDSEQMVYPDMYFNVDNYEEMFSTCVLRDCEFLCVELTAYDLGGRLQGVCFLGAIQYGSLKRLYESKARSCHLANNRNFLGRRFGSMSNTYIGQSTEPAAAKFLQLLGPQANGLVEFAVICSDESDESFNRQSNLQLASMCCTCRDAFSSDAPSQGFPTSFNVIDKSSRVVTSLSEACSFRRVQSFETDAPPTYTVASPSEINEFPPIVNCDHVIPLQPFPCSVQSAGASVETSPVRTWRHSCNRFFRTADSSASLSGHTRMSCTHLNNISHSHTSRMSKLLTRFTQCGMDSSMHLSTNFPHATPTEARSGTSFHPGERDLNNAGDLWTIPGENFPPEQHGRTKDSFAQSWSWFKERRRLASAKLSAGLTFISLPCHSILSDLLETKREPILNIAY